MPLWYAVCRISEGRRWYFLAAKAGIKESEEELYRLESHECTGEFNLSLHYIDMYALTASLSAASWMVSAVASVTLVSKVCDKPGLPLHNSYPPLISTPCVVVRLIMPGHEV